PAQRGSMMIHPKGKKSHTDYEVIRKWKGYAILNLQIHTGRTHQIRVHLKHLGYPVVHDKVYGRERGIYLSDIKKNYRIPGKEKEEAALIKRLALHSAKIVFTDQSGKEQIIACPLPKDFSVVIKQLDKWG